MREESVLQAQARMEAESKMQEQSRPPGPSSSSMGLSGGIVLGVFGLVLEACLEPISCRFRKQR